MRVAHVVTVEDRKGRAIGLAPRLQRRKAHSRQKGTRHADRRRGVAGGPRNLVLQRISEEIAARSCAGLRQGLCESRFPVILQARLADGRRPSDDAREHVVGVAQRRRERPRARHLERPGEQTSKPRHPDNRPAPFLQRLGDLDKVVHPTQIVARRLKGITVAMDQVVERVVQAQFAVHRTPLVFEHPRRHFLRRGTAVPTRQHGREPQQPLLVHPVVALYAVRAVHDVHRHLPQHAILDERPDLLRRLLRHGRQPRILLDGGADGVVRGCDLLHREAFPRMVEQPAVVLGVELGPVSRLRLVVVARVIVGQLPEDHGAGVGVTRIAGKKVGDAEVFDGAQHEVARRPVRVEGHKPELLGHARLLPSSAVVRIRAGEQRPVLEPASHERQEVVGRIDLFADRTANLVRFVGRDDPVVAPDLVHGVAVDGATRQVNDRVAGRFGRGHEQTQTLVIVLHPFVGPRHDRIAFVPRPLMRLEVPRKRRQLCFRVERAPRFCLHVSAA